MDRQLVELLQRCTVKLSVPDKNGHAGTGFFVATGLILTCAHVVRKTSDRPIKVFWQHQIYSATVKRLPEDPQKVDLALLELNDPIPNHPCVYLDGEVRSDDSLYTFGYPNDFPEGAPVTFECEGITGDSPPFIKFKAGQVRPGLSGSPLLNQRTGKICGIIKFTLASSIDLGGGAIPTTVIFSQLPELVGENRQFHQQDIQWTKFLPRPSPPIHLTRQEFQNRRDILTEVKQEVDARLEQSLHKAVFINLLKEKQPQQVKRPWDVEIKIGHQPSTQLPASTNIIEVFDREAVAGKLLILGAPGAGKTTTLLQLARDLIARAEIDIDEPIPVLFNLSSWKNDDIAIAQWLVAELTLKYGKRKGIYQQWLDNHQILPLLDGLDELESERQERCIQAINHLLQQECRPKHLVVCSRLYEYELQSTKLQLNGAVCLQPLTESQIHKYLEDVKHPELWQSIQCDSNLLEMAKSPLLLSMMALVSQKISLQDWQQFKSTEERLQYLFNAYIQQMLERTIRGVWYAKGKEPPPERTKQWLSYLAKRLKQEAQTEFWIENMQPTWLLTRSQKRRYKIGFGIIQGIILWLGFVVFGFFAIESASMLGENKLIEEAMFSSYLNGMILLLILVVACVISSSSSLQFYSIKTIESLRFSWKQFNLNSRLIILNRRFLAYLSHLTILLIISSVSFVILADILLVVEIPLNKWFYTSLLIFLSPLTVVLFIFGISTVSSSLTLNDTISKKYPNQGIQKSIINAGIVCLIFYFIPTLVLVPTGTVLSLLFPNISALEPKYILETSLYFGLLSGFFSLNFFSPPIQHFSLRLVLWQNGSIPWNYARFLNYATERLFLQRIGGGYRFIHDLLREHFAQMQLDEEFSIIAEIEHPWRVERILTGELEGLSSVVISPNGEILISGDKNIKLWSLTTGKLLQTLKSNSDWIGSIAISSDGRVLASSGFDKTIKIWDLNTGKLLRNLKGHSDVINCVAISSNNQILVSGSLDKTIKLWNLNTGELLRTLKGHSSGIRSLYISLDSQTFASGDLDGKIKLWHLETGMLLQNLKGHSGNNLFKKLLLPSVGYQTIIGAIIISPDSQILASGSRDKSIKIWHLETGKLLRTLTGHSNMVLCLAISPDGRTLVSGSADETIKLWNLDTGELLCTLSGHSSHVRSIVFSPDGKMLVSASVDKTIRIWYQSC